RIPSNVTPPYMIVGTAKSVMPATNLASRDSVIWNLHRIGIVGPSRPFSVGGEVLTTSSLERRKYARRRRSWVGRRRLELLPRLNGSRREKFTGIRNAAELV